MTIDVSDARSNADDQLEHAAKVLGRSTIRRRVFEAIYFGKRKTKTVDDIARRTGLPPKRVLMEGKRLAGNHIVKQTKLDGKTAYEKDEFYAIKKGTILSLAGNPKKLASLPTKTRARAGSTIIIRVPAQRVQAREVHVDDIDSFRRVRSIAASANRVPMLEATFKKGLQEIVGEKGRFADWGGEKNDLLTTKVRINGRRRTTAFALKGRGKKGTLTPAGMGKNGDQIQRLFSSPADVFLLQYWGEVDESVRGQMRVYAKAKSVSTGAEVLFGIIDGEDSERLLRAYPKAFGRAETMRKRR